MKGKKLLLKSISCLLVVVFAATVFLACKSKSNEGIDGIDKFNTVKLYYLNEERTALLCDEYTLTETTTDGQVNEIIDIYFEDLGDEKYKLPLGTAIGLNEYSFNNSIITLDFSKDYTRLETSKELLMRACLVLTLVQIDGVDFVSFTVENQPFLDAKGVIVGNMNDSNFVDIQVKDSNLDREMEIVLYFADESGKKLVEVDRNIMYNDVKSIERIVVENIIEGPLNSEKNACITLNKDVEILSISTKDGICYVNLSESFFDENLNVTSDVVIYSIVNSLCELNFVNQVVITVAGDSKIMFYESIDLKDPFVRNQDIVKETD